MFVYCLSCGSLCTRSLPPDLNVFRETSYFSFCRLSICSVRIRSSCCIASCCCSFTPASAPSSTPPPPPALSPSTTVVALGLSGGEDVWVLLCRILFLLCKFTERKWHRVRGVVRVCGWSIIIRLLLVTCNRYGGQTADSLQTRLGVLST